MAATERESTPSDQNLKVLRYAERWRAAREVRKVRAYLPAAEKW
jgi:hypothetical protein